MEELKEEERWPDPSTMYSQTLCSILRDLTTCLTLGDIMALHRLVLAKAGVSHTHRQLWSHNSLMSHVVTTCRSLAISFHYLSKHLLLWLADHMHAAERLWVRL